MEPSKFVSISPAKEHAPSVVTLAEDTEDPAYVRKRSRPGRSTRSPRDPNALEVAARLIVPSNEGLRRPHLGSGRGFLRAAASDGTEARKERQREKLRVPDHFFDPSVAAGAGACSVGTSVGSSVDPAPNPEGAVSDARSGGT